jgi:hypothetical protein
MSGYPQIGYENDCAEQRRCIAGAERAVAWRSGVGQGSR